MCRGKESGPLGIRHYEIKTPPGHTNERPATYGVIVKFFFDEGIPNVAGSRTKVLIFFRVIISDVDFELVVAVHFRDRRVPVNFLPTDVDGPRPRDPVASQGFEPSL